MSSHVAPWITAFGMIATLVTTSATTRSQSSSSENLAAAQALDDQAEEEIAKGNYDSASRKLEEAIQLVPEAIGARMSLGKCYQAQGRLASAWSQFVLVETQARKLGQRDRADRAAAAAAELKSRLATLKIDVSGAVAGVSGLQVTRDGSPVGKGQWGIAVPVDSGSHEVIASAAGYKPFRRSVEILADGANSQIEIGTLVVDPDAPVPGAPIVAVLDRSWQHPAGWTVGAVGLAGVGVGAIFGGLAIMRKQQSNADGHCLLTNQCDAQGNALRNEAVLWGNTSTVAFVAGGVLFAGGVVLLATAPSKSKTRTGSVQLLNLSLSGSGVEVSGEW